MMQRLLPLNYYGECRVTKELKEKGTPIERIPEMLFDCYKMNRCLPCVLHEDTIWICKSNDIKIMKMKKGD
jgi:hypothetical protein